MFIPGGCFCCDPPEDPCVLSGCTWSSTDMSDTDLTAGTAYYNPVSGTTPDGSYEITNAQDTGTGNDAPCRKITIETIEAPQKPDTVYAICWKDNATHNPSTQCPLTSVSFCVESKRHGDSDSGLTDSVVFVVRQNNRIFATAAQSVGVNWKRASGTYTQNSFTEIDGAGNPDFTAAGTSIEFGFALKLLVGEDDEPLDVVMFDNLCITKSANCGGYTCGCIDSSCVYENEGSSGASVSNTYGTGSVSYSVDNSIGCVAPSHKVQFTGLSGTGQWHSLAYLLFDDVISFQASCQNVTARTCMLVKAERVYNTPSSAGAFGHRIAYFQSGQWFISGSERLLGGSYNPGTLPNGFLKIEEGAAWPGTGNGWIRVDPAVFNGNLSTSTIGTGWFPSSGPDMTTDFQVGAILMTNATGGSTVNGWFDNICVKAVYGTCPAGDMAATVSGVTMTFKPGSGCNSGFVSAAESAINSTLVLSQQATSGSSCQWRYSGVSGTVPGAVNYSLSLTLGGKVGDDYTTGSIRIIAGSAGNNMPADYTLASPFDPCAEDGTFNFVSAIGSASCLILSGSSPITVSLI